MEATKAFVHVIPEQEKTDLHLKAEEKILGPENK